MSAIVAYAKNLGLAFQIIDDLLDVEGTPEQTGKPTRQDVKNTTFVSFSGVDGARQLARELCETADGALQPFGRRADRLRELSAFVAIGAGDLGMQTKAQVDVDALRDKLRSLGYLDAGVDRFVLAGARSGRSVSAIAWQSSIRIGLLAGLLLGGPTPGLGWQSR